MDRRKFLTVTGLIAVASALEVAPAGAQVLEGTTPAVVPASEPAFHAPGTYQIVGRVRLQDAHVAISGISNTQQISWADLARVGSPVASFSSFEVFDTPWRMPDIHVEGGRLESVAVVPVQLVDAA